MGYQKSVLKKANTQTSYAPWQVQELVKCQDDLLHFARKYVQIVHPVRGLIPYEPFEFQRETIIDFNDGHDLILCQARQSGKSTTFAICLLWYAIFNDHKTVLICSNHNANAMEIISRIQGVYENIPDWLKPGVDPSEYNKHNVSFDNGSRIVSCATTKDSGRGLSISLVMVDELAFVNPNIAEAFWTSISPVLSTGGRLVVASTPNGDQNLYAQLWRSSNAGTFNCKPKMVTWDQVP